MPTGGFDKLLRDAAGVFVLLQHAAGSDHSMGAKVVPFVDNAFTLVLFCTTPFNLIKGIVTSLLVFLLYKHISPILHR